MSFSGREGADGANAQLALSAHLEGGPGNDTLLGSSFRDLLFGGPGADFFDDADGQGLSTDGTPGHVSPIQDDVVAGCERIRVAVSAG